MRTFETELPSGYREAAHICGMESGFWNDLKTVLPGLFLAVAGCIYVKPPLTQIGLSLLVFVLCIWPYFVLHELVHAVVYMAATGQPVKIGFTKGGAYCSMPELFIYRTVAAVCTAAPLVVFSIILGAGITFGILCGHWMFLPAALLLALHLLGCRSDSRLLLEIGKYKDPNTLVRDNGTEQWIYQFIA